MLDVHIDDFWKDCAATLLHGLRQFPKTQTLYIEDISGPDDMDEFGLHSDRHLAALGTVQWLKEEGYVRYSSVHRQDSVDEFALTAKAFTCLIAIVDPDSIKLADDLEDNSPVYQVLEYALLQTDTTWLAQLIKKHIFRL